MIENISTMSNASPLSSKSSGMTKIFSMNMVCQKEIAQIIGKGRMAFIVLDSQEQDCMEFQLMQRI